MLELNAAIPLLDVALPTEAQWEYVCRTGTTDATTLGAEEMLEDIAGYAVYDGANTKEVGMKRRNAWGCSTCWAMSGSGAPIASARTSNNPSRTRSGRIATSGSSEEGSFSSDASIIRAAYRFWMGGVGRYGGLGFRLARPGTDGRGAASP